MTTNDTFDRRLAAWLDSEAEGRVRDHLAEVLVTTRATRQRPGWSSLERWLPMTTLASPRYVLPRPLVPILLVLALLCAALVGFAILQAGRSNIPQLGHAVNGRIVYADDSTVYSVAPDGSARQVVSHVPAGPFGFAISPDGDLVAYSAEDDHVEIARVAADRAPIKVTAVGMRAYGLVTWSPDGRQIAFIAADSDNDHLFVSNADGTNVHQVAADAIPAGDGVFWVGFSPDGRSIAFVHRGQGPAGRLVVAAPDGTAARTLQTPEIEMDDGGGAVAWSPDPSTPRILYVASGGSTHYYDLAANQDIGVARGFWASWSPTGDRISYWDNGTKIVATPTSSNGVRSPIEVFPTLTGSGDCPAHPELAGKALCGAAVWSPDGTRVIGPDITGNGLLSLNSDGSGDPILIDLTVDATPGNGGYFVWQPRLR